MNAAARLVGGLGKYDHVTPVLRDMLHWLPIQQITDYLPTNTECSGKSLLFIYNLFGINMEGRVKFAIFHILREWHLVLQRIKVHYLF